MNTLILLLFLTPLSQHEIRVPAWQIALRADAVGTVGQDRIVSKELTEEQAMGLTKTQRDNYFKAQGDAYQYHQAQAYKHIGEKRYTEAVSSIISSLEISPKSEMFRFQLFDYYIEQHEPYKAYAAVAPEIDWMSINGGGPLRASLASAMLGKVYPGQREHLVQFLVDRIGNYPDTIVSALPKGSTPLDIMVMSALAIGTDECGKADLRRREMELYLKYASGLDWGNPIVGYLLGVEYVREERFIEADIYLAPAVDRATGWLKEEIERLLLRARGG